MRAFPTAIGQLLDAYGGLFLASRRRVGLLVLLATLFDPATGVVGLVAGASALASRTLLRLPALAGEADLLNAIYAGLALGAFYGGDWRTLAMGALGGLLAVLFGAAVNKVFHGPAGARGLPLLGAPFLITAWVLLAMARGLPLPVRWAWPQWPEWIPALFAQPLSSVGALFYVAHPVAGLLILVALLLASRVLTLLALAGSLLAHGVIHLASPAPAPGLLVLAAFNGALVALFVGGLLSTPRPRTVIVAAISVVITCALSAAMLALATPLGIPPLSSPFLLTVWLVHAALRPDSSAWWSRFWLPTPALPEDSMVAGRLAESRGIAAGSVALQPPFHGRMTVAQGVDGELTHQGAWRFALDFIRTEDQLSYQRNGEALGDFYVFDQPVLAPAWGTVVACRDDVADNVPGTMNLIDNWGNYLLIDVGNDLYVMLAHLRQGSLQVTVGQSVVPGTPLAHCGNSGRSAQPHLHLHVQRGLGLGAPTVPFHLCHCLLDGQRYALDACPTLGQSVEPAYGAPHLAAACTAYHGRIWEFNAEGRSWQLTAKTDLMGRSVLTSSTGGSLQAVSSPGLLALHRRSGAVDPILDGFALSFGLTPYATDAQSWTDAPDAALLPLPFWHRLAVLLRHPFGVNLQSVYRREWDGRRGLWRQSGTHRVRGLFGDLEACSVGWMSNLDGPVGFSLEVADEVLLDVTLARYGNRGDHGIPAWSANYMPQSP